MIDVVADISVQSAAQNVRPTPPPATPDKYGIRYINTGDWVESCTAVVETLDGEFQIIRWSEVHEKYTRAPVARKPLEAA